MATNETTETVSVTSANRSWRFEIFTEKNTDYTVRVHRETIKTVSDVTLPGVRGVTIDRSLAAVAGESYQVGPHTYTGAEVAALLAGIADIWATQDEAAEAARLAAIENPAVPEVPEAPAVPEEQA